MNWVVSILIVAPAAGFLCYLITKVAGRVFLAWPDVLTETRRTVNVKKGTVIVAWILALAVLVGASGAAMVWLVNHL